MALSRKFIWVLIDRDKNPELVKKCNMSAYPTLLTFGAKQEKVHRFSGFRKPKEFIAQLEDALKRWELYRKGEEWDTPDPRPDKICDGATIETFKAPSEEVAAGIAAIGDDLWIAHIGRLFKLDAKGGVKETYELPAGVMDLTTDGKTLFAVKSGWTAGEAIVEIDPATGKVAREITTAAMKKNKYHGANGIEFVGGKLVVLEGMNGLLHVVDPATGDIEKAVKTSEKWLGGLGHDGTHYLVGSREKLYWIDGDGKTVKSAAMNYPLRSIGFAAGAVLVIEQPVFGYDKEHKNVRIWPKETKVYKLTFGK